VSDEPSEGIELQSTAPSWTETGVKAVLALIPYVGGAIETVVADILARRRDRAGEMTEAAVREAGGADRLLDAVRRNERVADLLLAAASAATSTALAWKRRAMGRVVGRAATDDALVDESELLFRALSDLDGPEFGLLGRMATEKGGQDAVRALADAAPQPVVSGLVRNGVVDTVGTFDGPPVPVGVSQFGRSLLDFVSEPAAEST
jgi:hypothetical protein